MPALRPWFIGLALTLAILPLAAAATANPVAPYRHPVPGPVLKVENVSLDMGNATLTFTGEYAPLSVEGRAIGLFLSGSGTLVYTSAYPAEAPVFTRNLKEWTPLTAGTTVKGPSATIAFKEARILGSGLPLPAWQGAAGGDLGKVMEGHAKVFDSLFAYDPAQGLALQAANAGSGPFFVAELGDGTSRWVYGLDLAEQRLESLAWVEPDRLHSLRGGEAFCLIPLSSQPVQWDPHRGPGPLAYQIRDLEVDLTTADNTNALLRVKETLAAGVAGHRLLRFDLKRTFVATKGLRYLEVTRVSDGEGRDLPFDQAKEHLVVQLGAPTQPGTAIILRFEYGGGFLLRPGADSYWELAVGENWYPTFETFAGENFTFHGTVRTGGGWTAQLPGELVRRDREGALERIETRSTSPISMVCILGGNYHLAEETRDGLTVHIATYASELGAARKVLMDQTFAVIGYYKPFLGPFPFKDFSVVEKHAWGYGQAPAGMMFITQEAFNQQMYHHRLEEAAQALSSDVNLGVMKSMDVRHVFAHEIAHQYWGYVVKMPSAEEQWLTEAFADYCASLYDRDYKGKDYFKSDINAYFTKARWSSDMAPIPLANALLMKEESLRFSHRQDLLYAKGPALLASLHQELGDEVFLTWLKSIQSNFRWNFTSTRRVFELLNFITKKDYAPFLERYYWGLEVPPNRN